MIDRSIRSQYISLEPNRRIIAISDIHGNLDLLKKLLHKIQFHTEQDELFFVGDLLEKGHQNLATLYYLMELAQDPHVHLMIGNCDFVCKNILYDYRLDFLHEVLLKRKHSLLHEMAAQLHTSIDSQTNMLSMAHKLKNAYNKELSFIAELPHVIETQECIFAHAAILNEGTYGKEMRDIMTHERFFQKNYHFHKYVIVGHIPVSEYCETVCDFNPRIDEAKHMIAIDGGNGVKHAGQLNALLYQNGCFSYAHSDNLPKALVHQDFLPKQQDSLFITWHDREVQILQEEADRYYCKQLATNKNFWLPKPFLHQEHGFCSAENYTDYQISVHHGEYVKIVSMHGNYALVKKHGKMGWIPKKIITYKDSTT